MDQGLSKIQHLASLLNKKNIAYLSTWGSKDIIENGRKRFTMDHQASLVQEKQMPCSIIQIVFLYRLFTWLHHTGIDIKSNPASLHN